MDFLEFKEKTIHSVMHLMTSFLEEYGAGYTQADVERCGALILAYLEALEVLPSADDGAIMARVEELVLALNELNAQTDYELIETEAREVIWEVIQESAIAAGLQASSDDITEPWREW